MASTTHSGFSLPPPHLLLFELLSASAAVGCTPSASWLRLATLPVLSACSYGIIHNGALYMRPRWASLLGGFSVAVLFRYLDIGLISRWSYENQGPAATPPIARTNPGTPATSNPTFFQRLQYGWNTLWSFRQVNTPFEVRNVPRFSSSDPTYVPPWRKFVLQQALSAATCYLLLDVLGQRGPPSNLAQFAPSQIPVFARLSSITASDIKLRTLTILGFGATFFLIIQGFTSLAATLAVGAGLSTVENWRPTFGSIWEAYSLKNVWGKFWHQLLRRPLTAPASFFVHDVLRLPRHSSLAGTLTIMCVFALSGVLHTAAGVSGGGVAARELGVVRFFFTQALGLIAEQGIASLLYKVGKQDEDRDRESSAPAWHVRVAGYVWVIAFMTWTGPSWIYPQAARAPPQGATAFLPFSMIGWLKGR